MEVFVHRVADALGIHVRPAGLIAETAQPFGSAITLSCKGKTANAKGPLSVMSLGAKHGDEVRVSCEGEDEAAAARALEAFFRQRV